MNVSYFDGALYERNRMTAILLHQDKRKPTVADGLESQGVIVLVVISIEDAGS
jgi:hypothetical protein